MHRFLSVLFTSELRAGEKKKIIETEYNIPMTEDLNRKVNVMCNLNGAIFQKMQQMNTYLKMKADFSPHASSLTLNSDIC